MIAGHDTTSTALSYALYSLGRYPAIQDKLYQELNSKIGVDSEPTLEQIEECEYLSMFLKENLRVYPS
jgi:cytochrome P450